MPRWIMALALSVSLTSAARAGGIHARIEGPAADGVTYTARTVGIEEHDALVPWALAEGVVNGKRRSVLIRLQPTSEHGVYQFKRTWPAEGLWMIRYSLGHPPAPCTVVTLGADGAVKRNQLYNRSDGSQECHRALKKAMHLDPNEENC